jgi:hypothetical protein
VEESSAGGYSSGRPAFASIFSHMGFAMAAERTRGTSPGETRGGWRYWSTGR